MLKFIVIPIFILAVGCGIPAHQKLVSLPVTLRPAPSGYGSTYYISVTGNDQADGLTVDTAWLTPNHAGLYCNTDKIMAQPGNYSYLNFAGGQWGAVNCPGGGGAVLLECSTFAQCNITDNSSDASSHAMQIGNSYWGVVGWTLSASSTPGACIVIYPWGGAEIHHIVIADNVCNGAGGGGIVVEVDSQNVSIGADYIAIVGNAVYNAAQNSISCNSGISVFKPAVWDTASGTHIYVAGNFLWGNIDGPCSGGVPTDGEGIIYDTFSASNYNQQGVITNNMVGWNGGRGIQVFSNPDAAVIITQNTAYGDNTQAGQTANQCGEIDIFRASNTQASGNLAETVTPAGCGGMTDFGLYITNGDGTDAMSGNWANDASGNNSGVTDSGSFAYGSNVLGTDPAFAATTEPGAPNCASYSSVPDCMAGMIAGLTPTAAGASAYGYQTPSNTPVNDPLYPAWLCNLTLPPGLVTPGCLKSSKR